MACKSWARMELHYSVRLGMLSPALVNAAKMEALAAADLRNVRPPSTS